MSNINFENYFHEMVEDLQNLIRIPTLYDEASHSAAMPYGKNLDAGLAYMKQLAARDGFEVREYDGHALAIIGNNNTERVDVVSHLDVVEPGIGWNDDPFSGKIEDGKLYGRGTQDMKSSLILTYYALKIIKDYDIQLTKSLRVVTGCDEERSMQDIEHYISVAGEPSFAFTPDGYFPLSIGEKGALMWRLKGNTKTCIYSLNGGVQCNVIAPIATALVKSSKVAEFAAMFKKLNLGGSLQQQGNMIEIKVEGVAAHASTPEKGINAIIAICNLIEQVTHDKFAKKIVEVFSDGNGIGANIDCDLPPMGKLTLNLGILKVTDGEVYGEIDCRYPFGIDSESLTRLIGEVCAPLAISLDYDARPIMNDIDSSNIKILLNTYREMTGDTETQPFISGGVTYSKVIQNCVAFGPHRPGQHSLAHQANEYIELDSLMPLLELYTQSMIELASVKE